ncbi:MAG: DUF4041 domain-containing protein [Dactylosporangium sp.]|nr:DUF4041 domain-containing protein [Dactylosporangium sp.]
MLRYWDGRQWTPHRLPNSRSAIPAPMAAGSGRGSDVGPARVVPAGGDAGPATLSGGQGEPSVKVPLFGARAAVREQAAEVQRLREELNRLVDVDVASARAERAEVVREIEQLRRRAGEEATRLNRELQALRERVDVVRGVDDLRRWARQERTKLETELAQLRQQVVTTREDAVLQEAGIYEYHHPLEDSVAYRTELARLKDEIKAMARRDGGAIEAATGWTVNGSATEGRKMVREYSKLMLRAYNAEADNLVRGLKPYKIATAKDRLVKVAHTIARLGATMSIRVAPTYHGLRIRELELTADYLETLAKEKEKERAERERLREERKVQEEMRRERERLEKERQHYLNALSALEARSDIEGAERLRAQLSEVDKTIADVDYRAANVRAGYVYVISNIGAFGPDVVKIGLTRRLEPTDRIRELGDASVPFRFDVHALFFSKDAVGIETQMHQLLDEHRVNKVNHRREFFRATPAQARDLLQQLAGELLQFQELPEAIEYHQSQSPDSSGVELESSS